jgi:hypothetical protein
LLSCRAALPLSRKTLNYVTGLIRRRKPIGSRLDPVPGIVRGYLGIP